jgi:hypothetical protein
MTGPSEATFCKAIIESTLSDKNYLLQTNACEMGTSKLGAEAGLCFGISERDVSF